MKLLEARPGLALVLRGRSGAEDDRYLATEMLAEAAASGTELPSLSAAEAGFFGLSWWWQALSVAGMVAAICLVYVFLNVATRGYYVWSLRVAAIILAALAILFLA